MEELQAIPIIDLEPFTSENSSQEEKNKTVQCMQKACTEIGFFLCKKPWDRFAASKNTFQESKNFFDLNLEAKSSYVAEKNPLFRGYNSLKTGYHNCQQQENQDFKESFTLGAPILEKKYSSPMHGPNQWPSELEDFRNTLTEYFEKMTNLARVIAKILSLSLQLDPNFFPDLMQDPVAQLVLLKYHVDKEQKRIGCGQHTDCGFLTILALDQVPGLEVRNKSGNWIKAPFLENMFVCNLGDLVQFWTNEKYTSTWHKVVTNTEQNRYSIPFFCNSDFYAKVKKIENGKEAEEQGIDAGDYILEKLGLMHIKEQE